MKHLQDKAIKFGGDSGWGKFHNPKYLAISLSLEACELLENFHKSFLKHQ
ncbi:MAG: hypothetical protein PME_35720 [Priestia megaterium]